MAFSPGELEKIETLRPDESSPTASFQHETLSLRFVLTSNFLGLTGSVSPLPLYVADEAISPDGDGELKRDFLDIFHHRLLGLLYRGVCKSDIAGQYSKDREDLWSRRLLALLGVWDPLAQMPPSFTTIDILRAAPILATQVRSARSIAQMLDIVLEPYLGAARCEIEQLIGEWTTLDPSQQMFLGQRCSELGVSSVIGVQCLHRASKARIKIGPIDKNNFRPFLEDGQAFRIAHDALATFVQDPIDFELDLVIAGDARRTGILGVSQLGVDHWLYSSDRNDTTHIIVPMNSPR